MALAPPLSPSRQLLNASLMFTFLFPVHPSVASSSSLTGFCLCPSHLPAFPPHLSPALSCPFLWLWIRLQKPHRRHMRPWIVLKCLSREDKANRLGDDRALWILMAAQPVFCCPSQSARASQMYFLSRIYKASDLYSLEGTLVTACFSCRLFGLPLSILNGLS